MTEVNPILDDPILKGQEAERIITSPLWVHVWNQMEAQVVDAWKADQSIDAQRMAELKRTHMVILKVKQHMEAAIANGRYELEQREKTLRQKAAEFFGV